MINEAHFSYCKSYARLDGQDYLGDSFNERRHARGEKIIGRAKLTLGALSLVFDRRNELTVVYPGMSVSLPANTVQCCLKLGRGTDQSTFLDKHSDTQQIGSPPSDEWCM